MDIKTILLLAAIGLVFAYIVYIAYRRIRISNYNSFINRMLEFGKKGDVDKAVKYYETESEGFNEKKFLALMNIVIAAGQYEKALELFEKIRKKRKDTFNINMMHGYTLFLLGRFKDANIIYDEMLELYPDNSNVINFNIASLYIEGDDIESIKKAEGIFQDILSKGNLQNRFNVLINLGFAQMKLGKYNDAILNETAALEIIPKQDNFNSLFALAHYIMGVCKYNMKDNAGAKQEFLLAKKHTVSDEFIKKIDTHLDLIEHN